MLYETSLQRRALFLTSLTHFVNDGAAMVPLSIFPLLLSAFGLTAPELGVVAAMWNITSVIGSPAVGYLSDRSRRNTVLLTSGLAMIALGIVGIGWSVTTGSIRDLLPLGLYPALILFTAISGLGSSVCHPVGGTVLSQVYPASRIGRALGLNGALGSLGRALYPTVVVVLITLLNLPYGVIVLGLFGLLPVALFGLFPIDTRPENRSRVSQKPVQSLDTRQRDPVRSSFVNRSARISVLVLTTIAFLRGAFGQGIVAFLSVFVVEVQKYSFSFGVGVIVMVSIVLSVPGQVIFGQFSDLHRKGSLVVNTAGQALAILLYLFTLSNAILSIAFLALFGFFTYSSYPVLLSSVPDAVPTEFLSLSNAIVWGVGLLGGNAVGPLIVGLFVGNNLSLLPTIFFILAVVSGLSTGLVAFLPRRSR